MFQVKSLHAASKFSMSAKQLEHVLGVLPAEHIFSSPADFSELLRMAAAFQNRCH
jgi:mannose-1-phosphate guanylyltransferase